MVYFAHLQGSGKEHFLPEEARRDARAQLGRGERGRGGGHKPGMVAKWL